MRIIESVKYKTELREIAFYIRKDKKNASIAFVKELKNSINKLINFPYKNRKSIYFGSDDIRDMTFKGYTIIYEIFENKIEILSIFNQNKPNE